MGNPRRALVITSIAEDDHPVLNGIARDSISHGIDFIVIGDSKSPDRFKLEGCEFLGLADQRRLDFDFARLAPVRHYSRKNIGYLHAMSKGYGVIQETDDDNIPREAFWDDYDFHREGVGFTEEGWVNVYRWFTKSFIWPRGLPLEEVLSSKTAVPRGLKAFCPVIQGLADENPDVDAVFRLTRDLPVFFDEGERYIIMAKDAWCPFNSQNTLWDRTAFPLMYLPTYCSFRMTDIWRSFVVQRICWEYGWGILFHHPTVYQLRNEHNLLHDFEDEVPGYVNNDRIAKALGKLRLSKDVGDIYENLTTCYHTLVDMGVVGEGEKELLQAWVRDCSRMLES